METSGTIRALEPLQKKYPQKKIGGTSGTSGTLTRGNIYETTGTVCEKTTKETVGFWGSRGWEEQYNTIIIQAVKQYYEKQQITIVIVSQLDIVYETYQNTLIYLLSKLLCIHFPYFPNKVSSTTSPCNSIAQRKYIRPLTKGTSISNEVKIYTSY